jgi:hypothetical protein
MGIVSDHTDIDEWLDSELVPAAAGQEAIIVTTWSDGSEPSVAVERIGVVAWGISRMAALPVIAGDAPSSNQVVLILHPDGRVADPFNQEWPSIDEVRVEFQKTTQAEWKEKQAAREANPDKPD